MLRIFLTLGLIAIAPAFAQPITQQDLEQHQKQMEAAKKMMESPEYQAQMKKAAEEMKKHGMDSSALKNMPQMNAKSMEAAMGMSKCVNEKVGADGMNRMSANGKAYNEKIKTLCAAGKKDEAEQATKAYAAEMMGSKEYQGIRSCADKYKPAMNDPAFAQMKSQMQSVKNGDKNTDICG